MRSVAPSGAWATGRALHAAVGLQHIGRGRASLSRSRMALRALSIAPCSRRSAAYVQRHDHGRPGHWPISTAPVTATVISVDAQAQPRQVLEPGAVTPRPTGAMAATARAMPGHVHCSQWAASAPRANTSAAAMRGQGGSVPWSWSSSVAQRCRRCRRWRWCWRRRVHACGLSCAWPWSWPRGLVLVHAMIGNLATSCSSMPQQSPQHRIGDAAWLSGVSAANIRYYEKEGLLRPGGGDNSYRFIVRQTCTGCASYACAGPWTCR